MITLPSIFLCFLQRIKNCYLTKRVMPAKAIFPEVVVQRCIVHLIRNSLKYVPTRDYKNFTAHLKKIYGAPSLKACRVEFERFCQVWDKYPGAIAVWKRCFAYVEQLFDYPSAVRKIMYTTNAIEAVNSSFRKVTKRGSFPNDNSVFKLLYLRVVELQKSGQTALSPTGRLSAISFSWMTASPLFSTNSTANFPYLHNPLDTAQSIPKHIQPVVRILHTHFFD